MHDNDSKDIEGVECDHYKKSGDFYLKCKNYYNQLSMLSHLLT